MTANNIFKIALIFTGTILGAGFATGKELVTFFGVLGKNGAYSFFISCFLLSLCAIAILKAIYTTNTKTYSDFMESIFGRFGTYIQYFNICFLFILFSAMLAGGATTISQVFCINEMVSLLIFCVITFFSLIFGENAIIKVNTILCPFLIICGMLIGIYLYFYGDAPVFNQKTSAIVSSVVYTSYNAITTISVLFAVKNMVINKKVVFLGGVLSGIFVFCIGIFMLLPLIQNIDYVKDLPLPLFSLIQDNAFIQNLYTITVLCAIFTTAVSNGVAIQNSFKNDTVFFKAVIVLLGAVFSIMGFNNIVSVVYPVFGYLGMFEMLVIVILFFAKV